MRTILSRRVSENTVQQYVGLTLDTLSLQHVEYFFTMNETLVCVISWCYEYSSGLCRHGSTAVVHRVPIGRAQTTTGEIYVPVYACTAETGTAAVHVVLIKCSTLYLFI